MTRLVVLGATGSIGLQTLDVADRLELEVAAIAARSGSGSLLELAAAHPEAQVGVAEPTPTERQRLVAALGDRVLFGPEALV